MLAKPIDVERVIVVDSGLREVRAGIFVAQALNHANHHREQVCAILTGLGIQPPDLQAWDYAWATGRIRDRDRPQGHGPIVRGDGQHMVLGGARLEDEEEHVLAVFNSVIPAQRLAQLIRTGDSDFLLSLVKSR
ncbi:hypothetical protein [Nonomuraea sp. SYSU D8015]|uniref:hypothetical protein n=1 Tax=Nonomuraea sp. SYSU D8015 TaxID=2593644 RepID=UPI00300C49CB